MNDAKVPQTADLSDAHPDAAVAEPAFRSFGGVTAFGGTIRTVECFEDNSRVRSTLESPGDGAVLVVDGGGSLRCALVGDRLAALAIEHGWSGVVVNGCVRDTALLADMDLGVVALAPHPRRSEKRNTGECDVPVTFAGVTFTPGDLVRVDADGIIVLSSAATG